MDDVARRAGVSKAAVSFVLNGRAAGRVAPATQARVRAAAEALGYVTHARARALRSGHSDLVLLPMAEELTISHAEILGLARFVDDLGAAGYVVTVTSTGGRQGVDLARYWAELRPAAVVMPVRLATPEVVDVVRRAGGVAVALGTTESPSAPTVLVDDGRLGRVAATELVRRGATDLVVVVPDPSTAPDLTATRHAGVLEVTPRARTVSMAPTPEAAGRVVGDWVAGGLPDGVVGTTDVLAGLVLGALLDAGVRVPGDVGLVGIDDEPLARITRPRLTSVGYAVEADGGRLSRPVLAAIEDRWDPELARLGWPPRLHRRDT